MGHSLGSCSGDSFDCSHLGSGIQEEEQQGEEDDF
jgi:hypothetical protein